MSTIRGAAAALIAAAAPGVATAQSMAGMHMPMPESADTAQPATNAPPPPVPTDNVADRRYASAGMAQARRRMMEEQGGQILYQVLFNLAEYQARRGHDGYRWDGEAWIGGDFDRLQLRTEGTGTIRGRVDDGEVQALYSRAVDPYFDVQAGVRRDVGSGPARTYATIGAEGLAPYMIRAEARLFVSTHGEVLGRLEGWYDQRLTQRIILQPRVELNFSAQDIRERRVGAGLYDAELGLRLRYEITRRFAPYVGLSHEAATGRAADDIRADGHDPVTTSLVGGVRFWF
jgi:copper resistance protein B